MAEAVVVYCNGKRVLARKNGRGKYICRCGKQLNFLVEMKERVSYGEAVRDS